MIFHYNYPINISKITRITKLKKLEILDFGCGIGNWIPHDVNLKKIKKIINDLEKNKKKLFIIFTDVPYLSRILEFSLLPFFNLKRFIYVLKIIFLSEYKKINFFIYKKNSFNIFKSKFNLIFSKNLHDLKFLRYSLIMRLK